MQSISNRRAGVANTLAFGVRSALKDLVIRDRVLYPPPIFLKIIYTSIMRVPFYWQMNEYTCGPASLQMVFEYFGKHMKQEALAKVLKTNEEVGTTHEKLIQTATNNGFYCYVNNSSTISEIKYFLSRNFPVIVHFIEPEDNDPHYAVVVAYEKPYLIFNDPWSGREARMSEDRFVRYWHDEKNTHKRWVMVLSQEDLKLGKQYLPKDRL